MSTKHAKLFAKFSVLRGSFWLAVCATLLIAGCAQTPPPSPTAAPDSSIVPTSPSVAAPSTPTPSVAPAPKPMEAPPAATNAQPDPRIIATTSVLTPSGKTRYECVKGSNRTPIGLPEGSERVCSRFPAMGPCQYERDACRASGGRVIRFDGTEITKEVENEYDRQVQRFRLNAG
jgi:hypothetical protein